MRLRVFILMGTAALAAATARAQPVIDSAVPDPAGLLKISGRGFGTAARVELGGRPLPVVSSTDVLVQALLAPPPPPGTYRVRVTRGTPPPLSADFVVSLGVAGPPGPAGPAGPAGPPATATELALSVDCAAGGSVGDALRANAGHLGRLTITVNGRCRETIRIDRDDVVIAASAAGGSFEAPAFGGALVDVKGRRVRLRGLTLNGAGLATDGIFVDSAAELGALNVTVHDVKVGMEVDPGGMAFLDACRFRQDTPRTAGAPSVGLSVRGSVVSGGTQISGPFDIGVRVEHGSWISGEDVIEGPEQGLFATDGATVQIAHDQVLGSTQQGILAQGNATVRVIDGEIRGCLIGIEAGDASYVTLEGVTVRDGTLGVAARLGSTIALGNRASVEHNAGNGLELYDTSTLRGGDYRIADNGRLGVLCTAVPSAGQLLGSFTAAQISGNALGQVSGCPGIALP
jgi:parallel beta helix pectate lyase-like protein